MPRPSRGPYLYVRRLKDGARTFVIRDGQREIRTGVDASRRSDAERALDAYRIDRWVEPEKGHRLTVADAVAIYARDHAGGAATPTRIAAAIRALAPFWAARHADAVTPALCREYARRRGVGPGTMRYELTILRAALRHAARDGLIPMPSGFWLPQAPPPKDCWLTLAEAARLLNACRSADRRHIARFVLVGLYTGSRATNILTLRWRRSPEGGWIDVDAGLLYRRAETERRTSKRRPPARLPAPLLAHARRWRRDGAETVIHYRGRPVRFIQQGFARACAEAGLEGVTRHTLRHTAITWAMQRGADPAQVASFFGVTLEEIQRTYWHHHPNFQADVARIMGRKT